MRLFFSGNAAWCIIFAIIIRWRKDHQLSVRKWVGTCCESNVNRARSICLRTRILNKMKFNDPRAHLQIHFSIEFTHFYCGQWFKIIKEYIRNKIIIKIIKNIRVRHCTLNTSIFAINFIYMWNWVDYDILCAL